MDVWPEDTVFRQYTDNCPVCGVYTRLRARCVEENQETDVTLKYICKECDIKQEQELQMTTKEIRKKNL